MPTNDSRIRPACQVARILTVDVSRKAEPRTNADEVYLSALVRVRPRPVTLFVNSYLGFLTRGRSSRKIAHPFSAVALRNAQLYSVEMIPTSEADYG